MDKYTTAMYIQGVQGNNKMKNQKEQIKMTINQAAKEGIKAFETKITAAPANNKNFMEACEESPISNGTLFRAYGYGANVARLADGHPKNSSIVKELNRITKTN